MCGFGVPANIYPRVFVSLSALGNVLTVTFAQARVNQELAKEGVLPWSRFWASAWPKRAPSAGLLLHFIPSFIVLIAIPFGRAVTLHVLAIANQIGSQATLITSSLMLKDTQVLSLTSLLSLAYSSCDGEHHRFLDLSRYGGQLQRSFFAVKGS